MAAGTGVSWRFTFGLDVQNSSSQGWPLRLAVSWCPAGATEGSTDPWLLPVAWASHSWVLRKSSPIAHISKDAGGSCKASYGLRCLTSALFCWSNFTRMQYKEPWFTWFTPSLETGSHLSYENCISNIEREFIKIFWIMDFLLTSQRPFSSTTYILIVCLLRLSFINTWYLGKQGLAVFWSELTVRWMLLMYLMNSLLQGTFDSIA